MKNTSSGYDYMILIPALILLSLGLVIVYSASSNLSAHRMGSAYFYLKRQMFFCFLGLGIMIAAKNIPCAIYSRLVYPLIFVSLGLLTLLFIPGIGHKAGGATRWLNIAGLSFQPSELAKFSLAVFVAYSMAKKGSEMESFSKGFLPHLIVAGIFMFLIVLQPDLGTAVLMGCWLVIILFVGGVRLKHLLGVLILSAPVIYWLITKVDYRLNRWLAFLDPWKDPTGIGYHIIHSFLAFGSGGLLGAGLGNGKQKLFYLPEPHTDFALSVAGEEFGFVGIAAIIILFGILIIRGLMVSLNARDIYSSYLALGLTCMIGLQVVVNMGVVMGLLPTKGLTLPLISYGGSSLVLNLFAIGILLNVSSRS
jgi:cell division protein FtsW